MRQWDGSFDGNGSNNSNGVYKRQKRKQELNGSERNGKTQKERAENFISMLMD